MLYDINIIMSENDMLNNALKLYETGKKNYSKDMKLAKKCFTLSLETLNKLKNSKIKSDYEDLIQITEVECIKMLQHSKQSENIFDLISKNDIETIKNIKHINFREINSIGNTVLHHAIDIGDIGIIKELFKKGGMIDTVNGNGHTLLEYTCLKNDPNIIFFLANHGANIEKHLFFRKGNNKFYLNKSDIDIAILLKLIISNTTKKPLENNPSKFIFLETYFSNNELIGLDKFTIKDIIVGLDYMFYNKPSGETYKQIIIEELDYHIQQTNKCIYNKFDIILSNLVPFINYPFNMSSIFLIKNEIKHLIKNIIKTNKKDYKNILLSKLFETYVSTHLFPEDYIGIIVFNILSKIKV